MSLEDMVSNFRKVSILNLYEGWHVNVIEGEWDSETAGGCPNDMSEFYKNPQYLFNIPETTECVFYIQQEDKRGTGEEDQLVHLGFKAYKNDGKKIEKDQPLYVSMRGFDSGTFFNSRDHKVEKTIEACENYTFIPSTFKAGDEASFTITIYSKKPIEISKL